MITMNLQYFGGRGGAGGKRTSTAPASTSTTKEKTRTITSRQMLTLSSGSRIQVQRFSAITGKPTKEYKEFTLSEGRWSSRDGESFENTLSGLRQLNSTKGTVPEIRYIKKQKK